MSLREGYLEKKGPGVTATKFVRKYCVLMESEMAVYSDKPTKSKPCEEMLGLDGCYCEIDPKDNAYFKLTGNKTIHFRVEEGDNKMDWISLLEWNCGCQQSGKPVLTPKSETASRGELFAASPTSPPKPDKKSSIKSPASGGRGPKKSVSIENNAKAKSPKSRELDPAKIAAQVEESVRGRLMTINNFSAFLLVAEDGEYVRMWGALQDGILQIYAQGRAQAVKELRIEQNCHVDYDRSAEWGFTLTMPSGTVCYFRAECMDDRNEWMDALGYERENLLADIDTPDGDPNTARKAYIDRKLQRYGLGDDSDTIVLEGTIPLFVGGDLAAQTAEEANKKLTAKEKKKLRTYSVRDALADAGEFEYSGYLFKKGEKGIPTFKKRYFVMENSGRLSYYENFSAFEKSRDKPIAEVDLVDRFVLLEAPPSLVFRLAHLKQRSYVLKADTEDERNDWVQVLSQFNVTVHESKEALQKLAADALANGLSPKVEVSEFYLLAQSFIDQMGQIFDEDYEQLVGTVEVNRSSDLPAKLAVAITRAKSLKKAYYQSMEDTEAEIQQVRNQIADVNEEIRKLPPGWIDGSAVDRCMLCNAEFGLTKRRHHCRKCGKVACKTCTNFFTELLEFQGHRDAKGSPYHKPVRVCFNCYEERPFDVKTK